MLTRIGATQCCANPASGNNSATTTNSLFIGWSPLAADLMTAARELRSVSMLASGSTSDAPQSADMPALSSGGGAAGQALDGAHPERAARRAPAFQRALRPSRGRERPRAVHEAQGAGARR